MRDQRGMQMIVPLDRFTKILPRSARLQCPRWAEIHTQITPRKVGLSRVSTTPWRGNSARSTDKSRCFESPLIDSLCWHVATFLWSLERTNSNAGLRHAPHGCRLPSGSSIRQAAFRALPVPVRFELAAEFLALYDSMTPFKAQM